MRILVFTESFPIPASPSRSIFIRAQVEALRSLHEVTVLFPRPMLPMVPSALIEPREANRDESADGHWRTTVEVKRPRYFYVPRHRGIRIRQLAGLLRRTLLAAKPSYDVVHAHWLSPAGMAAVQGAADLGIPVIVTAHAGDVYRDLKHPRHARVAAEVVRRASRVIAVAGYFQEPLQRLGLEPGRWRLIPNGVDTRLFAPAEAERARVELQLPIGVPLYLYIGDLKQEKGVMDVVDAFTAHAPRAARLVIAGSGPLWGWLEQRVAADGRVILRGMQPHAQVARYLNAADCFVLASYNEGNPVTVLESHCCGRPVIGSAIPAIAPLIEEGRNGLLVPPGDIQALGCVMNLLPTMAWDQSRISQTAAARYGWQTVATRISEVYTEAVTENHRLPKASHSPSLQAAAPRS